MSVEVAFRVDASVEIGTGHAMRCLTLARALRDRGADCRFLMRDLPGHLGPVIATEGFALVLLRAPGPDDRPEADLAHAAWLGVARATDAAETAQALAPAPPDWLVVDHYALEAGWEAAARPAGTRLLVLDDLADRDHLADLLLDQNLGRSHADYDGRVPAGCIRLIGPRFALLRPQFAAARPEALARRGTDRPGHLLISMGGIDKDNATGTILAALARGGLPAGWRVTAVMGGRAPHLARVQAQAAALPYPCTIAVDVRDMARLMTEADLAIGGAGSTTWERCCLGLPTLLLTLADNQHAAAAALDRAGAAVLVGDVRDAGWAERLAAVAGRFVTGRVSLGEMSPIAAEITDGKGTERVIESMIAISRRSA